MDVKDVAETIGFAALVICGIAALIFVVGFLLTASFAFVGWILLEVVDIFTTIDITYLKATVVGLCVAFFIGWNRV